ncbi:MAG: ATP-binding protein [Longimicrobiales bacterium]|nr:ATP-binding protein [Longimicrobiales bacterium]
MAAVKPRERASTPKHRLDARLRELECHYTVSRIIEDAGRAVDHVLLATARALPAAWACPADACARVRLRGRDHRTENWRDTPWRQSAAIAVQGADAGAVEVAYLKRHAFRPEEQALLDSVAQRLGRYVEHVENAHRFEAQEAELRKRLLHLTRVTTVGELASGITHEVIQPLTAIAIYAQACRRMVDSGDGRDRVSQILGRITDEALRAGDIVHRLKELVRRRESERRLWSLNALVLQVAPLAKVDARLHGVVLHLDLEADLPAILVDGVQIQQVLLNLIRNGVDAMEGQEAEEPEVVVRTRRTVPDGIRVSVSDRGCGLPDKAEEELYQPFFTTKRDGMGMGLSISRSIILMHGGRLWFERDQPRGTTFHFTIPTADGAPDD